MTNLLTLEIDNLGDVLSKTAPEYSILNNLLPSVGENLAGHWNWPTNAKMKGYLQNVFTSKVAIQFPINLNYHLIELTAHQYTPNKAFIYCKYIDKMPIPQSPPPQIADWGFEKYIKGFEQEVQRDVVDPGLFFKEIVDSLPIGIIVYKFFQDGSFVVSYTNKEINAIAPTFSKKKQSVNNDSLFERVHPDDKTRMQDAVRELFELKDIDIEWRMIEAGVTKNIRLRGKPLFSNEDKSITVYTYIQDLTQEKMLEERLNLVDHAFRTAAFPMYFIRSDGRIHDFNKSIQESLGYTEYEFKNLTVFDLSSRHDPESWSRRIEELKKGTYGPHFTKIKKKDGLQMEVEMLSNLFEYNNQYFVTSSFTDITEKKKIEDQLRLIDFSIRNASTPMNFIRKDGSFFDFNNATCSLLGYTIEEFKILTIPDINPFFDKQGWDLRWQDIKTKGGQPLATKLKKKDGSLLDIEVRANIINYSGIEICCANYINITEKLILENSLKKELGHLRTLIDTLPFPVFIKDTHARKLMSNKLDVQILSQKKTLAEVIGKTDIEIFNDKIGRQGYDQDMSVLSTGVPIKDELETFYHKNGELYEVLTTKMPIFDESGNVSGLVGFCLDVTEKRRNDEKLKLVDYAFRNATTSIFLLRSDGSLYDYNEACYKMLGYSKEEFGNLHQKDIDPSLTDELIKIGWKLLKTEGRLRHSHKIIKKDGTYIDVDISANYITYSGFELNCAFVTDTTEKKKLEANLRLIQHAFLNANVAMHFLNKDMSIYSFNNKAAELLGYSMEEYKNIKINDFLETKYSDEKWEERWQFYKEYGQRSIEVKLKKKDNTWIYAQSDSSYIRFEETELVFVTFNDITEKKKTEAQLIKSNSRYENATIATSDAIFEVDLINNSVFLSKNYYNILGYSHNKIKDIYHNDWIDNIHPEDFPRIMDSIQKTMSGKRDKWQNEYRIKKVDGEYIVALDRGFTIKNDEGKVISIVGAIQDITQKKHEEHRLKLMESVVLNTNDAILITEAEQLDFPGPRILFVNHAFEKMSGYTSEEVLGKTPRILQNEETDRKELDRLYASLKKCESCEIIVSNSKKNGEKFWTSFRVTPVANEKGLFTHWVSIQRDVTKEKQEAIEKEKLLNELIQNNQELKQFSYITTHNLRAPLTNLISICNIINTGTIQDALTVKLIDGFKQSTFQLNDTLNDLLRILIIKENRHLAKTTCDFETIFDKVKSSISNTLLKKEASIQTYFSEATKVDFVPSYIESIFLNFLTNSIKYAHPSRKPNIIIKTTREPNATIKLTYTDNGIGMNMARVKDKIFGLYQRFHSNSDSKGIGLYLVHAQVTALGGNIAVDSEVGVGTTFTITFK